MQFRKKPIVIDALQWTANNFQEMKEFCPHCYWSGALPINACSGVLIIPTLEGQHVASFGDWIIKGIAGEFYPCKPEIFEATYEAA
jgi:hypothetical protein